MVNILCVDWEYFIGATADQRAILFPDGGNALDIEGQLLIWRGCYEQSFINKELLGKVSITDIGSVESEITALFNLVEKYKKPTTSITVHEYAVEIDNVFTHGGFPNDDEINLFKIGFHHDCSTHVSVTEINAGNWVRILLNENKIQQFSWVKREDSTNSDCDVINCVHNKIGELHEAPNKLADGIDYIFICRSGMWAPPHLDNDFINTIGRLTDISRQQQDK